MRYVLDTNAVSAIMRGDTAILTRLRGVASADLGIPQPVLAELACGIARLPRSKRRTVLEERFELIRSEIGRAEWTDSVSEAFGTIKATLERRGERLEDLDVAIAAHGLALGAVLVTANRRHMLRVDGLDVEDWTEI